VDSTLDHVIKAISISFSMGSQVLMGTTLMQLRCLLKQNRYVVWLV